MAKTEKTAAKTEKLVTNGQSWKSAVKKIGGKAKDAPTAFASHSAGAGHAQVDGAFEMNASGKRTISLAPYEFARVTVGLTASFPSSLDRAEAYKRLRAVIDEMLSRELAAIRGDERKERPIEISDAFGRTVFLEYGLTIRLKEYENATIDVGRSEPLDDGADLDAELRTLGEWLGDLLGVESEAARAGKPLGGISSFQ
jgi:hypothetical protein